MSSAVPAFRAAGVRYCADACSPLREAIQSGSIRAHCLGHGHYPGQVLSQGTLPGIKMVGFWDTETDQDWGLAWHRNEGIELTFLERGALPFAVDKLDYELHADALTITRPWQEHRVGDPHVLASRLHWLILDIGVRRPHQRWQWPEWLIIDGQDLDQLTCLLRENEHPVWQGTAEMRRCFQGLARAVESRRTSYLALRINEILLFILDLLRNKKIDRDPSLTASQRTVRMFLNELRQCSDTLAQSWTLEGMAAHCGLGVTQFVHHTRTLTNMAPMHYLNHHRLEMAAKMLRVQQLQNVTDIALECGFTTSQYFATLFGRKFGCSPREFRRKARSRVECSN